MNRQERRALAFATRKAERKAGFPSSATNSTAVSDAAIPEPQPVTAPSAKPQISQAQLTANQLNALKSTGPKTEEGKRKSSCNAVKTALTGMTVLLPTDDVATYEKLGKKFIALHQPVNFEEELLVQSLIDTEWRLMRINSEESGIYARGRLELVDSVPADLLDTEVYLKYERNLKNLCLHENRLRRYRENDLKALKELQAARREQEEKEAAAQPKQASQTPPQPRSEQPKPGNGFVFTTPEIVANTHTNPSEEESTQAA